MDSKTAKTPFWIFLLCSFTQVIFFLFVYSLGWAIIKHYYGFSNNLDWGLTFLLALYAFFLSTLVEWLFLFFTKGAYLVPTITILFISLGLLTYSSRYPYRSLFLLASLLLAFVTSGILFYRLRQWAQGKEQAIADSADDLLDDNWIA